MKNLNFTLADIKNYREFVGGNNYVNLAGREKDIQERITKREIIPRYNAQHTLDDFYRIRRMEADVMTIEDFYYMVSVCNLKYISIIMMERNAATQQREAL